MQAVTKTSIRRDLKPVLRNLDPRWLKAGSHRIGNNILKLLEKIKQSRPIDAVLGYTSFFPGEVNLSYFFSAMSPESRIFLPLVDEESMQFFDVGKLWHESVYSGHYSLPEHNESLVPFEDDTSNWTVVLVPGMAFDRKGNRLGRGKGHYDRFLARYPSVTTIGVCWDLQIMESLPVEDHDQPLSWICTENEIMNCRARV